MALAFQYRTVVLGSALVATPLDCNMEVKEIKLEEIRSLIPDYIFIDRYTNKKGIKLYLIRTKDIYKTDYTDKKNLTFTALPKYFPSKLSSPPEFNFRVLLGTMYQLKWGLKEKYTDFLFHYGFYEFKKWLNEIEEFENQNAELKLLQNEETITPTFMNGELELPFDKEDDLRLLKIAQTNILESFYKGITKEKISSDYLKEVCFVPDKIFELAFNSLAKSNYIDIEKGTLTSEGLSQFRNEDIEREEVRTFSHTVFIAQAFNLTMEDIYSSVFYPLIAEDLKLSPIKINDTDPDDPVDVEILNQIKQARFLICDLTFARPSVYFEVGYAIARGIKVFLTARYDHNSDNPDFGKRESFEYKIHFDLRNRQITWWNPDNLEKFKEELLLRINRYLEYQLKQRQQPIPQLKPIS